MASAESRPPFADATTIDARVVKALGHPTRIRILALLRDRGLVSPVEVASELGLALGTVGYHVRRLETLGFIELAKRTPRRGAVEHHYRACATLDPAPSLRRPTPLPSGAAAGEAITACAAAQDALGRGGFDAVAARCDVRIVTLDARGRAELSEAADGWSSAIARIARGNPAAAAHTCTVATMVFDVD